MNERYYRNRRILQGYNHLLKQIDDLTCDYAELYTQATKVNQVLNDDVRPVNHDVKSKVEGVTIKLAEKKAALERAITRRNKIDKAINRLSYKWRIIIKTVDIDGRSLSYATKKLKMNYPYVCSKHKEIVEGMKL